MKQPAAEFQLNFDAASHTLLVSGQMVMATVPAMLTQAKKILDSAEQFDVDLQQVTHSDSAGLAMLIDLMRHASGSSKQIRFHNMPKQMLAIADASGLESILPVSD